MTNKATDPSRILEVLLVLTNGPLSSREVRDYVANAEAQSRQRTAGSKYGYYPQTPPPPASLSPILTRLRSEGLIEKDGKTKYYSLSELGRSRVDQLMTLYRCLSDEQRFY